ncbi:unnamed protein product [Rotaria sordida]|uniref:Uncharacterized protein n=1 Tax=Rotaria sordida TaxID=392033 RepID=A0A815D862_9BILA|nr:unnamed protein product [Rotaria sordida]
MSARNEQDTMTEKSKQHRDKSYSGLTLKQSLNYASSLLLPLMLGVFTIVITLHQTNLAQRQRLEDQQLAKIQREQDLNNAKIQREQDLKTSAQQRLEDREQAKKQRALDKEIADQQLNSSEEQRRHEMNIALAQYRDNLLIDYIREIGELLKTNNGSLTNDFVTKTLARAKTLAVIRQLDPSRNIELIRFLYEAGQLSTGKNPLDLSTARLNNIDFSSFSNLNMSRLSLSGAHLSNSSFAHIQLLNMDFTRWDLKPVLVLSARFGGKSTSITIGYSGNIYSLNSTHKEPIRFPLNYSMAMEVIRVAVIFGPSNDDLIPSWCDDIEVTVEVNDEPS